MNYELYVCDCSDVEHNFIVWTVDDDPYEKSLYIDIHLTNKSLWYRIKYAVKYIFGKKSKYGAYTEIILNKDSASELSNSLRDWVSLQQ